MSEYVEIEIDVECFSGRKRAVRDAIVRVLGKDVTFDGVRKRADPWIWAVCRTYLDSDDLRVDEDGESTPVAKDIARVCFGANGGPLGALEIRVGWIEQMPRDTLDLPTGTLLADWG